MLNGHADLGAAEGKMLFRKCWL